MKEKRRKIFWYMIAIGVIFLFVLVLASSIIDIGQKLREIHMAVEIAFYALVAFIIIFLIIRPIVIIVGSPSLSIVTTLDKDSIKAHQTYRSVSKNLLKENAGVLTEEETKMLKEYKNWDGLKLALYTCLNGSIKKEIRKIIVKHAKTVMISTAISQNAKLDMYSVVTVNLNMIKEIVRICGFRPSMKNLSKLTLKVATTALVADGMESLKLEDILPQSMMNTIANIPLLKPVLSSITQGLINALLSIRIGLVTRNYLFTDSNSIDKVKIQTQAFQEALILLPLVLAEVISFFPKKIVSFFKKEEAEPTNEPILGNEVPEIA